MLTKMKTMQTDEESSKSLPEKALKSQRKFALGAIMALWVSLILAFIIIGLPKTKDELTMQNPKIDSTPAQNNQSIPEKSNLVNSQKDSNLIALPKTTETKSTDLVFYSKKAFLKYFGNEYSEADLNKSLAVAKIENKQQNEEKEKKVFLKVVRKKTVAEKKEFSSDFEIKAVPNK
jgi:hypothetical protein